MAELSERKGFDARALEFLILTASRSGEVLGAQRSEIEPVVAVGPPQVRAEAPRPSVRERAARAQAKQAIKVARIAPGWTRRAGRDGARTCMTVA